MTDLLSVNPTEYTEIFKLKKMLEKAGIPFVFKDRFSRGWGGVKCYQIIYPCETYRVCSVIEGDGTYGSEENKLEIMGLLTAAEREHNEVAGWLSARQVFARIRRNYIAIKVNLVKRGIINNE